jgi:regulator of nonsense transcripts 1
MEKDEFTRKDDEKSLNSDSIGDFDEAFLEYGSDSEEDNKLLEENKNEVEKEDLDDNINKQEIDESYRDELEEEYQEEANQKEIRCAYCGITNPSILVKCNEKGCQRWFCNGRIDDYSASHIVFHLTKSKHKEVYVGEKSQVGEMTLECYNCNCKNIFLLGFLESKEGDSGFILCREPCLTTCKIEEEKFEKSKWVPLINDKKLMDWIVPLPNENELKLCHRVNIRNMSKMEDKWEKEKLQENQEKPKFLGNFLKSVKLCYNDGQDYLDIFEPLVSAEEEFDRKLKEAQKKPNIKVTFYKSNRRLVAKFVYPREDNEIKLVPGDELKIIDPRNNKAYRGFIIKMEMDDEVHLELDKTDTVLVDGIFTVEFVWKGTSFKRMLDGIYTFVNDESSVSSYIYYKILGHNIEESKCNYNIPKDLSVKGLPELNYFQTLGIKKALSTRLFLIQGPPGTGKTVTSAGIVYHMAKLNVGKVLVCAPSNIAADQLSEKIARTGVKVVRLCAKSRESISTRVEHLSLHNQIKQLPQKEYKRLIELMKLKEEIFELKKDDHEYYKKLKKKAENEVLQHAEVVVTTCIASFDKRLGNQRFPIVLVDEATQACESECMLPLLKGAKHVILVGDHCQLGPVVLCKNAAKAGLKISLFERLIKLKIKPHMLQVQYRMHPKLSEFPSNTFYNGNLQNGVSAEERIHYSVNFTWPNPNKPMFFYHIAGQEEFSASGTSYLNRREAEFIEKAVTALLKSTVKPDQIGIITPYEGQRCYVVSHMLKNGSVNTNLYKEIEVASVDSFQGREKDYIILSCVRSNDNNGIGFLNDPRRLNVALTRARYGLIIVGNALALSKHQLWDNLLHHFKANSLLVEGSLNGFRELMINLRTPQRYIPERLCFESQLNNTVDSLSIDISYTKEGSNKNNDDLMNDATVSRFSDFGYVNDKESVQHYRKVKDLIRSRPLKFSNEVTKNKYDMVIANYNSMSNNNLQSNVNAISMLNVNSNNMLNNNLFTNYNRNMFDNYSSVPQQRSCNTNQNYFRLMNNEKKFVMEAEF